MLSGDGNENTYSDDTYAHSDDGNENTYPDDAYAHSDDEDSSARDTDNDTNRN